MATISSHVLDSVIGTHASGIRVECIRHNPSGQSETVFDIKATSEGRISETIPVDVTKEAEYELVFHSADYFRDMPLPDDGFLVLKKIVVRLEIPDPDERYHLPIMLSPHSYSVWWSGKSV